MDKMRQQQSDLQRRLKEEVDRKSKLEVGRRSIIHSPAVRVTRTRTKMLSRRFAEGDGARAEAREGLGAEERTAEEGPQDQDAGSVGHAEEAAQRPAADGQVSPTNTSHLPPYSSSFSIFSSG